MAKVRIWMMFICFFLYDISFYYLTTGTISFKPKTKGLNHHSKCFLGGLAVAVLEKLYMLCGESLLVEHIATTTKPSRFKPNA